MNKYGLIMEGGAMRGMFTAGVMDVLMVALAFRLVQHLVVIINLTRLVELSVTIKNTAVTQGIAVFVHLLKLVTCMVQSSATLQFHTS